MDVTITSFKKVGTLSPKGWEIVGVFGVDFEHESLRIHFEGVRWLRKDGRDIFGFASRKGDDGKLHDVVVFQDSCREMWNLKMAHASKVYVAKAGIY